MGAPTGVALPQAGPLLIESFSIQGLFEFACFPEFTQEPSTPTRPLQGCCRSALVSVRSLIAQSMYSLDDIHIHAGIPGKTLPLKVTPLTGKVHDT